MGGRVVVEGRGEYSPVVVAGVVWLTWRSGWCGGGGMEWWCDGVVVMGVGVVWVL